MTSHVESQAEHPARVSPVLAVVAWLWVLVPFAYGLYQLVIKIPALIGH